LYLAEAVAACIAALQGPTDIADFTEEVRRLTIVSGVQEVADEVYRQVIEENLTAASLTVKNNQVTAVAPPHTAPPSPPAAP
jgi:hypothetical protein